jgi:hypothetical protein
MRKTLIAGFAAALLPAVFVSPAYACPTWHALTNGATADAVQVMDDFNSILQCPNFSGNALMTSGSYNGGFYVGDTINWGFSVSHSGVNYYTNVQFGGTGDNNRAIRFLDAGTERMRINGAGNVGIGTDSPSYTLHVNGSVAGTSAYNNLSDLRLKKDIRPITGALATIAKLRGVRFRWRTPQERTVAKTLDLPNDKPQIGFIAQDVRSVLPEAVTTAGGQEAILSMQESKIVPLLVEAVKELKAKNEQEIEAIAKLQREIAELRGDHHDIAVNETVFHRAALALGWR